jgi:hypothetical protein
MRGVDNKTCSRTNHDTSGVGRERKEGEKRCVIGPVSKETREELRANRTERQGIDKYDHNYFSRNDDYFGLGKGGSILAYKGQPNAHMLPKSGLVVDRHWNGKGELKLSARDVKWNHKLHLTHFWEGVSLKGYS